jgi:thiamine-monophosphate kinase
VTVPEKSLSAVRSATDIPLSVLGRVREPDHGISMDGEPLADRGYTHG